MESNLALACFNCNSFKDPNIAGLDPATGALARLFHPRTDAWHDHFEWHGALLIGLTEVGQVCTGSALGYDLCMDRIGGSASFQGVR